MCSQNGVFYAANQLYGLTFKERKDLPVYAPGMRVFEVFNADGSSLALFYCDYFKRDNKQGGAWMNNLCRPVQIARHAARLSVTSPISPCRLLASRP